MTEQLVVENWEKLQKVPFLKIVFCNIAPLGDQKKWSHMKVKSKISYLGERNSILPGQMAEQLAVEVDVKNVTYGAGGGGGGAGQAPLFCLDCPEGIFMVFMVLGYGAFT